MGSMSEYHSPLSTDFRRQTILPTEGVERRERRVGGLGLSFSRLLVCPLPEGYNASEISVVNNMLFRNRGIYYRSIIVKVERGATGISIPIFLIIWVLVLKVCSSPVFK